MSNSTTVTPTSIPAIDYTSRDFSSVSTDAINAIPFFTPEWTDRNPSDFGIVLIELQSMMADVLHYYIDRMAAEGFLPTAVLPQSVDGMMKLIAYSVGSPSAASVDVTFTLGEALPGNLLIPKGTQVQTLPDPSGTASVIFETAADLTIPENALTGSASVIQGVSYKSVPLGTSNGLANQTFPIPNSPVIQGTLVIYVDLGVGPIAWTAVDSLTNSTPTDQVYVPTTDSSGKTAVQFGDNGQGAIPTSGAAISGDYRIGGGVQGNVGANTIVTVVTPVLFNGAPVAISVTNPLAASGGADAESISSAKTNGPKTLAALYRAVAPTDYEALAKQVPGVAKVTAVVGHFPGSNHTVANPISLFVVPNGGGAVSTVLNQQILAKLGTIRVGGGIVEILDPSYAPVNIAGQVTVYSNFNLSAVQTNVMTAISNFFDPVSSQFISFGQQVNVSDFICYLNSVDGVAHVDLTDFTRQPIPNYVKWAGTGTVGGFTIGLSAVQEIWKVSFVDSLNTNKFNVSGSVSGDQGEGTVGSQFVSTNRNLTFTITPGASPTQVGDVVTFKTSPKIANISAGTTELFSEGDTSGLSFATATTAGPTVVCI